MTSPTLLLRMPLLHGELRPSSHDGQGSGTPLSLWPGLPDMPKTGYWKPDYPFGPEAAAGCLADMRAMGDAALSGVPVRSLAARDVSPAAARAAAEKADLERFAHDGERRDAVSPEVMDIARKAAQKSLLWAWLLEERALEVRELLRACGTGTTQLVDGLGVEHEDGVSELAALDLHMDAQMPESTDFLPPWRIVLENAALFLPERTQILVDSADMAADLREALGIAGIETAQAPLWRALGRTAPRPGCFWHQTVLSFLLQEIR